MNALLLVSALAVAQAAPHDHQHQHSEQIGRVSFQTSCSPQAHAIFERGVTWLHSFEYGQAEAAFNEAAAADPSCSIAHWGAAMSLYHPLWAPPKIIHQLFKHPLTDNGIKSFLADWEKTGQSI